MQIQGELDLGDNLQRQYQHRAADLRGNGLIKRKDARMQRTTKFIFFCGLVLLVLGSVAASAQAQEAPRIDLRANAPGWITVYWEHPGKDVYWFVIERQDAPYTDNNIAIVGQSYNNTDSLTDKNLRADTTYNYRVCAVYAYNRTCSDWKSARTLPSLPSGGSSGGGASPKPRPVPLDPPEFTASSPSPATIDLQWSTNQTYQLKNVQLFRDDQIIYDAKNYGGYTTAISNGVRLNTEYTYRLCLIGFDDQTTCSKDLIAMGKPVAPTAPADVNISKSSGARGVRNASGNSRIVGSVRITTLISARWRNTDLPGQFITLERENRVQLDRMRVGPAWDEIARISAKSAPTEASADITSNGPELGTQHLNNYRVCAVVPALKAAGKVCSPAVTVQ